MHAGIVRQDPLEFYLEGLLCDQDEVDAVLSCFSSNSVDESFLRGSF